MLLLLYSIECFSTRAGCHVTGRGPVTFRRSKTETKRTAAKFPFTEKKLFVLVLLHHHLRPRDRRRKGDSTPGGGRGGRGGGLKKGLEPVFLFHLNESRVLVMER